MFMDQMPIARLPPPTAIMQTPVVIHAAPRARTSVARASDPGMSAATPSANSRFPATKRLRSAMIWAAAFAELSLVFSSINAATARSTGARPSAMAHSSVRARVVRGSAERAAGSGRRSNADELIADMGPQSWEAEKGGGRLLLLHIAVKRNGRVGVWKFPGVGLNQG